MIEFLLHKEWLGYTQVLNVMGIGLIFFLMLYVLTALVTLLLSRIILPALNYGKVLDPRPVKPEQIRRELGLSLLSVLIFGLGLIFPWGLVQLGWATVLTNTPSFIIVLEIVVLMIWNEIHFYLNHRLLHTAFLKRFHLPHHRSFITTPWSTYSFHPIEALMLGNVIIVPMMVYDFDFYSLLAVPILSIIFNNIGHSNYDFLPDFHHDRWWLNGARRHHLHHACYQGNYGFMFPFMDRLLHTALAPDAADDKINRHIK
jgi:sterol desaturase/sphingolipid hydroxylase (fatty acid hydroxylase superfamily)